MVKLSQIDGIIIALVAQLDRVLDYESRGRGFESLRARQIRTRIDSLSLFFYVL